MIDVKLLREKPDEIREAIKNKQANPSLVDDFLAVDAEWRQATRDIEEMRARQKKFGEERKMEEAKSMKEEIKARENAFEALDARRVNLLKQIPNPPLPSAPVGKDGSENKTLREVGKKPEFKSKPKDYLSISEALGIIDMERAGKVSGSRFGYLLGAAARLEFALVQLALFTLTDQKIIGQIIKDKKLSIPATPFIPIIPPVLIKREMMEGMGYVERGADEIYFFDKDDMYLVGTSEQSIGPMHSGEIIPEAELPKRYLGFSTCFRREAGSYGKDTKGILRVHQFDKLEMFSITKPEWSAQEHQLLLGLEEYLMQKLGLPYRVLDICTGDLGDPAAAKYDIEAWMPGQNGGEGEYRETHSTSNTTDFQSRRLNIKYRKADGSSEFVHMLNGTAFSQRPLIAIIENLQTEDGGFLVPEALETFMGTKKIG